VKVCGDWEVKGEGRVMEGVEQTKSKVYPQHNTLRNPFELELVHPSVLVGEGRVKDKIKERIFV
jgi:hypothetical protein